MNYKILFTILCYTAWIVFAALTTAYLPHWLNITLIVSILACYYALKLWSRRAVARNPFQRGNDQWRRERLELRRKIIEGLQKRERTRSSAGWLVLVLVMGVLALTACKTPQLENGGAYAPGVTALATNVGGILVTNFTPSAQSDIGFYLVDSSFDLAYTTIDAVDKIELNNRALLWKISPQIKHSLDSIRPTTWEVVTAYTAARKAYIANPTPTGLTGLQTLLQKAQALASAATAAVNATNLPPTLSP